MNASHSQLLATVCAAIAFARLLTFENAADLKFFGGVPFALDFWHAVRGAPPPTLLKLPCDQMDRALDANQPILFEGRVAFRTAWD